MKKVFKTLLAVLPLIGFASCNPTDDPIIEEQEVTSGLYVINQGAAYAKIPASITSYSFELGQKDGVNAFLAANGIEMGEGAQNAIIYGSKMYVSMDESNIIWVLNAKTLKVIDKIQPEGEGKKPWGLVGHGGKVYSTLFTGHLAQIDTTTLKIEKTIQVGPNPTQVVALNNKLYVANSDGYGMKDCSISVVDPATMSETKIKDPLIFNPTEIRTNGTSIFLLAMGNYMDIRAKVLKLNPSTNKVEEVCPGTIMDVHENNLYVINAPYGGDYADITYKKYDATTLEAKGTFYDAGSSPLAEIGYPDQVFIDPVTGNIMLLSYKRAEWTDSEGKVQYGASYSEPCYGNIYDKEGKFKLRVNCGVGACKVAFVHDTHQIKR